ncbi:SRPBCC family protein [Modestobacter altitudinis]|uniref:SRPBCC family protein n=1 Tax=Modestobacter altitudinis TaxID=2213158 RepID=UPI00110CBA0A|nr:SRPBCC family protein [Modestobacter altitudinis]
MRMREFEVNGTTAASPTAVWRLLGDSATWPDWTPIDTHRQERAGGADGSGEVRVFRNGRYTLREEVIESRPLRRLSYTLLSGLAVRDYRADVDLSERADGGTDVRWHTTFVPKVPGTGRFYVSALRRATEQFVAGLTDSAALAGGPGADVREG